MAQNRPTEEEEVQPSIKDLFRATYNGVASTTGAGIATGTIVFMALWFTIGLAGFICSFVCLGYEGDMSAKVGGILISLFLGPLYWIYFGILRHKRAYCVTKK